MDLERKDILALIDDLVSEMKKRGTSGVINIYGGSAIAYYFEARAVTRDVDSLFQPYEEIREIAQELTLKYPGLGKDWLNSAVMEVMPSKPDENPEVYYQNENITVQFGSREYLLVMKATASRRAEQDRHDAALLFNDLALNSHLDIARLVAKYYDKNTNWGSQELFWEDIEELAQELNH